MLNVYLKSNVIFGKYQKQSFNYYIGDGLIIIHGCTWNCVFTYLYYVKYFHVHLLKVLSYNHLHKDMFIFIFFLMLFCMCFYNEIYSLCFVLLNTNNSLTRGYFFIYTKQLQKSQKKYTLLNPCV